MPKPCIIVHGGAGSILPDIWREYVSGSHLAAKAGQAVLNAGGTALDAAIAATIHMENDIAFNAGRGSALNLHGEVENDSLVMTDDYRCGAVAGVKGIVNPVLLARVVMEHTPHHLIVGNGAESLARQHGLATCDPAEMIVDRRRESYLAARQRALSFGDNPELSLKLKNGDPPGSDDEASDTVGAAAFDVNGNLAVASSTGGIQLKLPGRAGDTPVIGGGSYCGPAGAVTCTGHGESAMRVCLAKYAYDLLTKGMIAAEAARRAVDYLVETVQGRSGLVVVDAHGNRGWATSTDRITIGVVESLIEENYGDIEASI